MADWIRNGGHQPDDPAFIVPHDDQILNGKRVDLDSEVGILAEVQITIGASESGGRCFGTKPEWFNRATVELNRRVLAHGLVSRQAHLSSTSPQMIADRHQRFCALIQVIGYLLGLTERGYHSGGAR